VAALTARAVLCVGYAGRRDHQHRHCGYQQPAAFAHHRQQLLAALFAAYNLGEHPAGRLNR
jgi:hypothetical protein